MVQIPAEELAQLQRESRKLIALENAGVDSWGGYEQAMELLDEGDDV
jgi:hypothetical protein